MAEPSESWVLAGEDGLEISPQDDRKHRLVTLPNGLRALVTSDPTSEKAAAALAVMVGAMADPPELPGLAHFCEHMCFLGSEKYPEENAYKKYLSAHAGRSNASTSSDRTVFQFDVAVAHFEGALDIFAQFFVAPLFTEDATDREMKAVDSEDSKNRCNDGRRMLQVMRSLASPTHPFAKFSTGNLKTLHEDVPEGLDVRQALLDFHGRYYVASRMRLAICGREPLDELENWVHTLFSAVPNTVRPPSDLTSPAAVAVEAGAAGAAPPPPGPPPLCAPFADPFAGERPLLVEVAPLRELRDLQLTWPMPSMRSLYRSNALHLFSHLLGHEGEGSIFAQLQDRGWATALSAGSGHEDDNFSLFNVKVTLTPEGEDNWHQVLKLVIDYCQLLRNMQPADIQRHWAEVRAVSAIKFRFQQKVQPYDFVQAVARRLAACEPRHALSAGQLFNDLDMEGVAYLAQTFTLDRLIVRLVSQRLKGAEFTDEERWYKVPFSRRPLPPEAVAACADASNPGAVHFPAPNEYIPDDLSLRGTASEPRLDSPVTPPTMLVEDDWGRLWHKIDERYAQPRVEVYLLLRSPVVRTQLVYGHLLASYMSSRLKQSTYDATLAGLHWSVSHSVHGILLAISGYSQRAPRLLDRTLATLLAGPWADEGEASQALRFEAVRERIERAQKSWDLERPDAHAQYWADILLCPESLTVAEKLAATREASLDGMKQFHKRFMEGRVFLECFVSGNASPEDAQSFRDVALARLHEHSFSPLPVEEFPELPRNRLLPGDCIELRGPVANAQEQNSAAFAYFEAGELAVEQQAALRMITQVMREPCFNQLRTQQQIGYIVSSGIEVDYAGQRKIEGLSVTVLSNRLSAADVMGRINDFLTEFRGMLENLGDEGWASHVEALSTKLLEPPRKLSEEASRHWPLIRNRTLKWNWREDIVKALTGLSCRNAVALFDDMLPPGTRRRVDALIFGNAFPLEEAPAEDGAAAGEALAGRPATVCTRKVRIAAPAFAELRSSLPRFASLAGS